MQTLTLEQVKAANLPATVDTIGKYGGAYVVAYLPGSRYMGRFRVTGGDGTTLTGVFSNVVPEFGPGGEPVPQDGWHHEEGCDCEFCK